MSNKLVKKTDGVKQKYVGCTATTVGRITEKGKRKPWKELSREELLDRLKGTSVYVLVMMGLCIFIVDGTLYDVCDKLGTRYGINGRYLFLGIGGAYFIIFAIVAIWFSRLVWRYNFWNVKRR